MAVSTDTEDEDDVKKRRVSLEISDVGEWIFNIELFGDS